MNNSDYTVLDFQQDCNLFNELAEKHTQASMKDLNFQFKLIEEEVAEISEGLEKNDPVEILDGAVDTLVVLFGFIQKLEHLGFNVGKAMKDTAENNLSKFPEEESVVDASIKHYYDSDIPVRAKYNQRYGVFVIKDQNDKVRKPVDYVSNDLSDCVPNNLKDGLL